MQSVLDIWKRAESYAAIFSFLMNKDVRFVYTNDSISLYDENNQTEEVLKSMEIVRFLIPSDPGSIIVYRYEDSKFSWLLLKGSSIKKELIPENLIGVFNLQ